MSNCDHDIQPPVRQFPSAAMCLVFLVCAVMWVAPAAAQQMTENAVAAGLGGVTQTTKGQEVPIYSIQVFDASGPGIPLVHLGSVANAGIQLTLNDLNATTGFSPADVSELRLYRSTDAFVGAGDVLVATQSVTTSTVTIDATAAAAADRLVPVFPGI